MAADLRDPPPLIGPPVSYCKPLSRPLKWRLFARGLQSVRLPVKFLCVEEPNRGMSVRPNASSFRRKRETSRLQAASC
jgi:hypothetical protein